MDFLEVFKKYQDDIIKHTIELVSFKSVCVENEVVDGVTYRFGIENKKALDYILNLGCEMGFKTHNVENVCGHIEYGEGEELLAVLCHVDVVPAIGEWTRPPFECYLKDGKLYGRGTIDDKGPAITTLYALKAIKDLGLPLQKRIRLIFGTDEESGSRGLARYLEVMEKPKYGISPDANFPIIYGEKGILSIKFSGKNDSYLIAKGGVRLNVVAPFVDFETDNEEIKKLYNGKLHVEGISAHAMEPNNGRNAIKEFALSVKPFEKSKFIDFICDNLINTRLKDCGLDITDAEMGDLTMNMGLLDMNKESASLFINIRYPHNLDYPKFIEKFSKLAKSYGLELTVLSNSKPHYINPNTPFIKKLHASYKKYTNDDTPLMTIGGGTYARDLECGVAYGVNFPGEVEMAHETDEFAKVDSLMLAGTILMDAMYSLCKDKEWE